MAKRKSSAATRSTTATDIEWVGGVFHLGSYVEGDPPFRPKVGLWLQLPEGIIVGHRVDSPHERVGIADALRDALEVPAPRSRKPRRLRVGSAELAAEIRAAFGDQFEICVAPTPEVEQVFDDMELALSKVIPDGSPDASYLEGGRLDPAKVARMFRAARLFYAAAPWRVLLDSDVVRLDIPKLGVDGACLSIMGARGEYLGLAIFPSYLAFERFNDGAAAGFEGTRQTDLGTTSISLGFEKASDLPTSMKKEVMSHGWEVATPDAYPCVTKIDRNGVRMPTDPHDLEVATEAARAFTAFFVGNQDSFGPDRPRLSQSVAGENGIIATLTFPYPRHGEKRGATPRSGATSASPQRVPDNTPVSQSKIGRNDPCGCGSGKKYKKCCLGREQAERSSARNTAAIHERDGEIVRSLTRYAVEEFDEAWRDRVEKLLDIVADADEELPLGQLLTPWSVYGLAVNGERPVDRFLEERSTVLTSEERDWLIAQQRAWLGLWEIQSCEPGVGVTVRDSLSGETRSVREVMGSRSLVARDTILARVVDWKDFSVFCGMYPRALPPRHAAEVTERARRRLRRRTNIPLERLRDDNLGLFLIREWKAATDRWVAEASAPRKLVNTDGEELVLTADVFELEPAARAQLEERLRKLPGLDVDVDEDGSFVFAKSGNAVHASWTNTIVGRATFSKRTMRVETNSIARADMLRDAIQRSCDGIAIHRMRTHEDPASSKQGRSAPAQKAPSIPPEAVEALKQMKTSHYRAWLDTPIPALSGRTPREAVSSKAGRTQVDILLRDMENHEARFSQGAPFDFSSLRRELDLAP